MSSELTRRDALKKTLAGSVGLWAIACSSSQGPKEAGKEGEKSPQPTLTPGGDPPGDKMGGKVYEGKHEVVPLPFDPTKLTGLSEKMIASHHDNNYAGAVKNLNKVEQELAKVTKDTPGFVLGGLKERELTFTNSMILHEHYFGNLGGNGKASGAVEKLLAGVYGSFSQWEDEFRATGASLAGGSGWVILNYNFHNGMPQTYWSGNHTQNLAFGQPLLVMDICTSTPTRWTTAPPRPSTSTPSSRTSTGMRSTAA